MEESLVRDNVRGAFTPTVKYQLPKGVLLLCDDPEKSKILARMPVCNAFGIVGRTDHGPKPPAAKTRKSKAPASPEEGECLDTSDESEEESEEEYSSSEDVEEGDGRESGASKGDEEAGGDTTASDDEDDDDDDDDGDDDDDEDEKEVEPPRPLVPGRPPIPARCGGEK